MSNTLPDVQLLGSTWTELYATTGITVGTALIIQNKITAPALIQIRTTMPVTTLDGYSVPASGTVYLDGSLSGVWIRSNSPGRLVVMANDGGTA